MKKSYNLKKNLKTPEQKSTSAVRMVTVGNLLTKRRKELGKTIAQVSNETKISDTKLLSMESNDFTCFESPVHASGFIKIYADHLGLDTNRILAVYRRDYKGSNQKQGVRKPVEEVKRENGHNISQYILLVVPLLLILIILSYLYTQYHNFQNPPFLEIIEPENNIVITEDQVTLRGRTEKDTIINVNNVSISVDVDNGYLFEKNVPLQPGKNIITIKATNIRNSSRESAEILTIEYLEEEEHSENAEEEVVEDWKISLEIVNAPTWIEIIEDDQLITSEVLNVGFREIFTPARNISISTGIVENTKIEINKEEQIFDRERYTFACNLIEEEMECN